MTSPLPGIHQIQVPPGTADGDVTTYDAALGRLVMAPSTGGGGTVSSAESFFQGGG